MIPREKGASTIFVLKGLLPQEAQRVLNRQRKNPNASLTCINYHSDRSVARASSALPHFIRQDDSILSDMITADEVILSEKKSAPTENWISEPLPEMVIYFPNKEETRRILKEQARFSKREIILFWGIRNEPLFPVAEIPAINPRKMKRRIRHLTKKIMQADGIIIRNRMDSPEADL